MTEVKAELVGSVWKVKTQVGAQVAEEDELLILESMKMEIPVTAPRAGTVKEVRVHPQAARADPDERGGPAHEGPLRRGRGRRAATHGRGRARRTGGGGGGRAAGGDSHKVRVG